jgi:similar to stage IV sporulation protein
MERITNLLRGCVSLVVKGAFPENFLNLCARSGVEFWGTEPADDYTLCLCIHRRDLSRVEALAKRALCTVETTRQRGVPHMARRLKKRYVLLLGLILCLLSLTWSSLYIWEIEVTGNETVSSTEILRALDDCGVGVGSFWPSFVSDNIRSEALVRVPELSWLTVNVKGSKAEVIVRERVPKPEVVDEKLPTNVIAEKSGVITDMNVLRGRALTQKGFTVLAGDVLVSGAVPSTFSPVRAVHAMARIEARTWYELTAAAPLSQGVKSYTGEEQTHYSLEIGDKRINFYGNSGISDNNCDKIISEHRLGVTGLFSLPVAVVKETERQYGIVQETVDARQARTALEQSLLDRLAEELGESGQTVETAFSASEQNGWLYVTLRAECIEEIGGVREMSETELQSIQAEYTAGKEEQSE